jgi:hypothetical protein
LRREHATCPRCKREIRAGLAVCPHCGEDLARRRIPWKLLGSVGGLAVVAIVAYAILTLVPLPFSLPFVATAPTFTPTEVILPPTATFTATPRPPTATPTATATYTPIITETVTVTATTTLTPTMSPSPVQTDTPTPTETPGFAYAAPRLIEPEDQSNWAPDHPLVFSYGARIELRWEAVGTLAENEWYAVALTYTDSQNEPAVGQGGWTKETSWLVEGDDLYNLLGGDRIVKWSVTVVRDRSNTGDGVNISPPSETWTFRWG